MTRTDSYVILNVCVWFAVSNTFERALLAIYVIAGIVGGIILLLVLMCIAQRILTHKPKEYEENNLANAMRERMLRPHRNTPVMEPVVHYRSHPETNGEPRVRSFIWSNWP